VDGCAAAGAADGCAVFAAGAAAGVDADGTFLGPQDVTIKATARDPANNDSSFI
jgi:hypothetical protein